MFVKRLRLMLPLCLALYSCAKEREGWDKYVHASDVLDAQETITAELLKKHISTLASDEFEGRAPGTKGEEKTIQYLTESFTAAGLQPGNPDGTWIQKATMLGVTSDLRAQLLTDDERWVMKTGDDIIGNTYRTNKSVNLRRADLIFCGYGVNAPEYGWNDYEDVDVKGKVVVVLVNDPPVMKDDELDESMFGGNAMTYYGRWSYKFEEGLRQGAAGVIVVHETIPAGYPFSVLQNGYVGEQLTIEDKSQKPLAFQGWIPIESAERLFKMNGLDFQKSKAQAVNSDFKAVPFKSKFTSRMANFVRRFSSNNFIAKYEGSDPILKDEYIIYTAHWDHIGINKKLKGDQIYNGANDNGIGTGIVMAAAEAFTQLSEGSKRSVLFLAVTAEEQGLLGAKYYGINPLYPLEKTIAVVNVDAMGNTFGKTKDLVVVGKGNSELDQVLEFAAAQDKKYLIPDAEPEKGFYYRSDHFEFAKQGVPALYVDGGIDAIRKGKDFGMEMKDDYTKNHYHQVTDEVMPDWNYTGMVQDARILFRVGYALSQHDKWPEWSEKAEFKAKRDAMLAK